MVKNWGFQKKDAYRQLNTNKASVMAPLLAITIDLGWVKNVRLAVTITAFIVIIKTSFVLNDKLDNLYILYLFLVFGKLYIVHINKSWNN